jgi:hypothetical protein
MLCFFLLFSPRYNESIVNLDLFQTSVQTTRITLMSTLVTYKIRSSNFINCFKSNNISESLLDIWLCYNIKPIINLKTA